MSLTVRISEAIAHMEGFYNATPSVAWKNNNPGNLREPGKSEFRKFSHAGEGWKALHRQIDRNIRRGLTLYEFFGGKPGVYPGYAPSTDGNRPKEYAEYVAKYVGISPDVRLDQFPPM